LDPTDRATARSGDMDQLYRLSPTEWVLPEDGDRIQSPKRYLKQKQDCVLNKNRMMGNVQKHDICVHYRVQMIPQSVPRSFK
jgi:hypothetical protein